MIAVTSALPGGQDLARTAEHVGEVQAPEGLPDQEHGDQEAEVPDPVHDEGLLARVGIGLFGEPEADQEVGAETDAFPPDEHHREAGAQHQDQHECDEQVEVREVPRVARRPPSCTRC